MGKTVTGIISQTGLFKFGKNKSFQMTPRLLAQIASQMPGIAVQVGHGLKMSPVGSVTSAWLEGGLLKADMVINHSPVLKGFSLGYEISGLAKGELVEVDSVKVLHLAMTNKPRRERCLVAHVVEDSMDYNQFDFLPLVLTMVNTGVISMQDSAFVLQDQAQLLAKGLEAVQQTMPEFVLPADLDLATVLALSKLQRRVESPLMDQQTTKESVNELMLLDSETEIVEPVKPVKVYSVHPFLRK